MGIQIIGNLGRDPEMRYTPEGRAVCNFSVAENRYWTDKNNEKQKRTTWFRISFWGKSAEIVNQYFKQGDGIIVEGRLDCDPETGGPRLYQRQDGSWGAQYEVVGNKFIFPPGKKNGDSSSSKPVSEMTPEEDDIPF